MPNWRDRESGEPLAPEAQTDEGHMAFEEIVSVKINDELSDLKRFSILSWNAGPKRGKVANRVVGSFHVNLHLRGRIALSKSGTRCCPTVSHL